MARRKSTRTGIDWKAALLEDDVFRELLRGTIEQVLEAEMEEAVGASKWERTDGRLGYRSGYRGRTLVTRVGKLELRVPQDRAGRFSTELFERYQRSEKAFVSALAEMYIQGVSTRKVKAITEELCGHTVSASTVSTINQRLDEDLERFAREATRGAVPVRGAGRSLREDPGRQRDSFAGRAGGDRDQLGWAAVRAWGGVGQPRERLQLERLPA